MTHRSSARLLAVVCLVPGAALAQVGTVGPAHGCRNAVETSALCTEGRQCTTSEGAAGRCQAVPIDGGTRVRVCVGLDEEICCIDETLACPTDRHSVQAGLVCLCALDSFVYCSSEPSEIARCHELPGVSEIGSYLQGDCDGDGVVNGRELELGTDVCEAPSVGAWTAASDGTATCIATLATCDMPATTCTIDGVEGSHCRLTPAGPVCIPPPEVFCCGGQAGLECPLDGQGCVVPEDVLDGLGFCTRVADQLCGRTQAEIRQCFRSPAGELPVVFDDGDCDEDGVRNADEIAAGEDHCTAAPDAGSVAMDGGTEPTAPRFGGGGGCRCRASASGRTPSVLWLGAIALAWRRRACARSRAARG